MDLKEYLFKHRITVKEFSERVNYARGYISSVVNGKKPGRILAEMIEKITNGEIKAKDLLKNDNQKSNDDFNS